MATDGDEEIDTIPDEVLTYLLVSILGFLFILTVFTLSHSKGKFASKFGKIEKNLGCHRIDNVRPHRAWIFALQTWDLFTDVYFSYTLFATIIMEYEYRIDSNSIEVDLIRFLLAITSPIFIILPYSVNLYAAITLYKRILMNNRARLYFEQRSLFFCFLVLISGGVSASITLVSSKLFGLSIFDCGLTKREMEHFTTKFQFKYNILLENLPQLIIQVIYIIDIGYADTAVRLAIGASFINILTAIFRWCFTKQIDFDNQLILMLNVIFNKNTLQQDIRQCVQYMGYRQRLEYKISQALYVYSRKIEVFAVIPTNQGCIVHFGYVMDTCIHEVGNNNDNNNNDTNNNNNNDDPISTKNVTRRNAFELYETEEFVIHKIFDACKNNKRFPKAMKDTWNLLNIPSKVILINNFEIDMEMDYGLSDTEFDYELSKAMEESTYVPTYKLTQDLFSNFDSNDNKFRNKRVSGSIGSQTQTQALMTSQGDKDNNLNHRFTFSANLHPLSKAEISQVERGENITLAIPYSSQSNNNDNNNNNKANVSSLTKAESDHISTMTLHPPNSSNGSNNNSNNSNNSNSSNSSNKNKTKKKNNKKNSINEMSLVDSQGNKVNLIVNASGNVVNRQESSLQVDIDTVSNRNDQLMEMDIVEPSVQLRQSQQLQQIHENPSGTQISYDPKAFPSVTRLVSQGSDALFFNPYGGARDSSPFASDLIVASPMERDGNVASFGNFESGSSHSKSASKSATKSATKNSRSSGKFRKTKKFQNLNNKTSGFLSTYNNYTSYNIHNNHNIGNNQNENINNRDSNLNTNETQFINVQRMSSTNIDNDNFKKNQISIDIQNSNINSKLAKKDKIDENANDTDTDNDNDENNQEKKMIYGRAPTDNSGVESSPVTPKASNVESKIKFSGGINTTTSEIRLRNGKSNNNFNNNSSNSISNRHVLPVSYRHQIRGRRKSLLYNSTQSLLERENRMLKKQNRRLYSNNAKLLMYIQKSKYKMNNQHRKQQNNYNGLNVNKYYKPKLDIDILDCDVIGIGYANHDGKKD